MWVWNNFTFDSLLYILQNLVLVDWFAMAIKLLGICFSVWNCEGVPVDNSRILDQCYVHFIFSVTCLSSRSDRLLSFMLIYHLWPLPIKALPVHELVVWDMQYSTEYSKKKTKKKERNSQEIAVSWFFIRLDWDSFGTEMCIQKDPSLEHPTKTQHNKHCGCYYQTNAEMPPVILPRNGFCREEINSLSFWKQDQSQLWQMQDCRGNKY